MDIVFVYSGEFFKDVELEGIKNLFDSFNGGCETIEARRLEEIVKNTSVIGRFLKIGLLVKDGDKYRLKEDKVQELVEETLGLEADCNY